MDQNSAQYHEDVFFCKLLYQCFGPNFSYIHVDMLETLQIFWQKEVIDNNLSYEQIENISSEELINVYDNKKVLRLNRKFNSLAKKRKKGKWALNNWTHTVP